jgi:hypothetical protein
MILASVALTLFVSHWFVLLTVFVGANLLQYGFTGFCPAEIVFSKIGLKDCRSSASEPARTGCCG